MMNLSISSALVLICFFQLASLNANLIDDECPKTTNPDVCFSSLRQYYEKHDPPNVKELAIVLGSTVLVEKVYLIDDKINTLLKANTSQQDLLQKCATNFQTIKDDKVTEFRAAFVKSDYGGALLALDGITTLVNTCSKPLSNDSPDIKFIIDMCAFVTEVAFDDATLMKDIR